VACRTQGGAACARCAACARAGGRGSRARGAPRRKRRAPSPPSAPPDAYALTPPALAGCCCSSVASPESRPMACGCAPGAWREGAAREDWGASAATRCVRGAQLQASCAAGTVQPQRQGPAHPAGARGAASGPAPGGAQRARRGAGRAQWPHGGAAAAAAYPGGTWRPQQHGGSAARLPWGGRGRPRCVVWFSWRGSRTTRLGVCLCRSKRPPGPSAANELALQARGRAVTARAPADPPRTAPTPPREPAAGLPPGALHRPCSPALHAAPRPSAPWRSGSYKRFFGRRGLLLARPKKREALGNGGLEQGGVVGVSVGVTGGIGRERAGQGGAHATRGGWRVDGVCGWGGENGARAAGRGGPPGGGAKVQGEGIPKGATRHEGSEEDGGACAPPRVGGAGKAGGPRRGTTYRQGTRGGGGGPRAPAPPPARARARHAATAGGGR
jgi:hypothetical protein